MKRVLAALGLALGLAAFVARADELVVALSAVEAAPSDAALTKAQVAWRDARVERVELAYWRTTIGEEVDFVIEAGGKLLPIEVKATLKPRLADCAHLQIGRAHV